MLLLHILQWKLYVRTCTQPVIRKCYLLKNILACFGYSATFPFFLFLFEHKHFDNATTNSNSENARSRMVASLQGNKCTGTKEDESSLGCWISPCYGLLSLWARFETYEPFISLIFQFFFRAAANRGCGGPPVTAYIECLLALADVPFVFLDCCNGWKNNWVSIRGIENL